METVLVEMAKHSAFIVPYKTFSSLLALILWGGLSKVRHLLQENKKRN